MPQIRIAIGIFIDIKLCNITSTDTDMIPTGVILPFAGDTVPTGYLLCDGAEISQTTYAALFTAIGNAFDVGPIAGNFNVPDLRARVAVGKDAGNTSTRFLPSDASNLGVNGGEAWHQLSTDEIPAHSHSWGSNTPSATVMAGTDYNLNQGGAVADATSLTGADGTHINLQPYIVINYIIKT